MIAHYYDVDVVRTLSPSSSSFFFHFLCCGAEFNFFIRSSAKPPLPPIPPPRVKIMKSKYSGEANVENTLSPSSLVLCKYFGQNVYHFLSLILLFIHSSFKWSQGNKCSTDFSRDHFSKQDVWDIGRELRSLCFSKMLLAALGRVNSHNNCSHTSPAQSHPLRSFSELQPSSLPPTQIIKYYTFALCSASFKG